MELRNNKDRLCPESVGKIERFASLLARESYTVLGKLKCVAYTTDEPVPFADRFSGKRVDLKPGDKWGKNNFDCAWMRLTGRLPEGADFLMIDLSGEGLVYTDDGEAVQSITCGSSAFDPSLGAATKRVIPLYGSLVRDGEISLWVDAAANDLFGNLANDGRVMMADIVRRNAAVRDLSYDVAVLLEAAFYTKDGAFAEEIISKLAGIASDTITEETAKEKLAVTGALIKTGDTDLSACLTFTAIGHAHLDLAWLWPVRETKRKGARTFATQLRNTEMYADTGYIFGESQAQLYRWMKELYPDIYEEAKRLIAEGRWDVQGSTWVEPDSNLTSGESLCRQFFYGKRFFKEEFGLDRDIFWVPDSFGYSGCLPQIMRLAGVKYFLTQKMSWSIYNKFPYQSFYWKGIDGSTVLSHMLPEETYNSGMFVRSAAFAESNYFERAISDKAMILFGIGDGGAGPGYEHIERAVRQKNLKGLPKVKFSDSESFFKEFDDGVTPYPTYEGELYLERHQGTYTTHSDNKKYNRKCEFALQNYEKLSAVLPRSAQTISHAELEEMWKEILFYQFHDILPGSSINRVYEECVPHYKQIYNKLTNATADAAGALAKGKAAVNFNSFPYTVTVKDGGKWYRAEVPALGMAKIGKDDRVEKFSAAFLYNSIENDKVRVTFKDGYISSVFDKTLGREFITKDRLAAVISGYDDYGDSWDMVRECAAYTQTRQDARCVKFEAYTDGPKAVADASYEGDGFTARQVFYVIDGDNTVYCDLTVSLDKIRKMVRIAFPFDVDTEEAAFNIQYGHLKRRMTENNSVETAQFEVSGQKFADMSDENGGVALINDCKYGYRAKHGVLDLNLVRSPEGNPGHDIDLGSHEIRYAIMPHKAGDTAAVYAKAYFVNNPPVITDGEIGESGSCALYESDNPAVVIDTVKIPEDGNGIIVRAYNCTDADQTASIGFKGYRPAEIVNIMEESLSPAEDRFAFHKFELKNIRFVPAE